MQELLRMIPTAEEFLGLTEIERGHVLLQAIKQHCANPLTRMVTADSALTGLFSIAQDSYDRKRMEVVRRALSKSWKGLLDAGLIEPAQGENGKNGYVVPTDAARAVVHQVDLQAVRMRAALKPEMLHPDLRGAAHRAYANGDYDTAVLEGFKAVEVAVRDKGQLPDTLIGVALMHRAFDPNGGPLADMTLSETARRARMNLFAGTIGAFRNPKAHLRHAITDAAVAIEELMIASRLLRFVNP